MTDQLDDMVRTALHNAYGEPGETPGLALRVRVDHRRRQRRRVVVSGSVGTAVLAVLLLVVPGALRPGRLQPAQGPAPLPVADVHPVASVLDWGYADEVGAPLTPVVEGAADKAWRATTAGTGAPASSATVAAGFVTLAGTDTFVALVQLTSATGAHWVAFAVQGGGDTYTLQGLREVDSAVTQVSTVLHLDGFAEIVTVTGPTVAGVQATVAGHPVTLTPSGYDGVFQAASSGPVTDLRLLGAAGTSSRSRH